MKGSDSNNYHRCIYMEWKRRQGQHANEWNVQEERNSERARWCSFGQWNIKIAGWPVSSESNGIAVHTRSSKNGDRANSIIINAFSFYAAREHTCRTDHLDLNRPLNYLNTDQTGRKSKIRSRQTQRVTDRFEAESATTCRLFTAVS